jgi:hypothetical protein
MKAVVIRCPNCGSTQAALGECDACHHADVAYFCPNHAPGQWIDGPACPSCGARFGVAPARTGPVSDPPRRAPKPSSSVEWGPRSAPATPPDSRAESPDEVLARTIEEMLGRPASRAPRRTIHPPTPRGDEPEFATVDPSLVAREAARGAMGCVGRLVMVLIIFAVIAVLLVGGFLGGFLGALEQEGAAYALREPPIVDTRPVALRT